MDPGDQFMVTYEKLLNGNFWMEILVLFILMWIMDYWILNNISKVFPMFIQNVHKMYTTNKVYITKNKL